MVVRRSYSAPVVCYDLETSGLDLATCEILQIGAVSLQGPSSRYFSRYTNPTQPIDPAASAVNGLTEVGGYLHKGNVFLNAEPLETALKAFIDFLASFDSKCVLLAHNGDSFDHPFLLKAITKHGLLTGFLEHCSFMSDTLPLLRKKLGRRSVRLEDLSRDFLSQTTIHDGLRDAMQLRAIALLHLTTRKIISSSQPVSRYV